MRVLLVNHDRAESLRVRGLLDRAHGRAHELEWIPRYDEALAALLAGRHDLALIEDRPGDREGRELAREADRRGCSTPLIVLTRGSGTTADRAASGVGADDGPANGEIGTADPGCSLRDTVVLGRAAAAPPEGERLTRSILDSLSAHIAVLDGSGTILAVNRAWRDFVRAEGVDEAVVCEGADYLATSEALERPEAGRARALAEGLRDVLSGRRDAYVEEYPCHGPDGRRWFVGRITRMPCDGAPRAVVAHEEITGRVVADEAAERQRPFRLLAENCTDMISRHDAAGRFLYVSPACRSLLGYEPEQIVGRSVYDLLHPEDLAAAERFEEGLLGSPDPVRVVARLRRGDGTWRWFETTGRAVRDPTNRAVAEIQCSARDVNERVEAEAEIRRLNEGLERRLRRIEALRRIDSSINSGRDLRQTLAVVIEQVAGQLGADAAAVWLYDAQAGVIRHAAGPDLADGRRDPAGGVPDDPALRVAATGRPLHVPDLSRYAGPDAHLRRLIAAGFVGYHAVPLAAKGQVRGVLELAARAPLEPDSEWIDYLATLADQAAIAIDNATMYDGLPASHDRLSLAYDATIEGWARALDLRDKETEGHSRRVTEMTVRVARAMGLDEAELVQVRRGALLHDIGKMGVPDAILLKPGPLNEEETRAMRRHPELAVEMLEPIEFLRPALDIPHGHHERWDGTGYPRGLAGEAIPIAARIFAAVDIWDALGHDRPYRRAWPPPQVREHIRELAGSHLDPDVVAAFLRILDEGPTAAAPETAACAAHGIRGFLESSSVDPAGSVRFPPKATDEAATTPSRPEVPESMSEPDPRSESPAPGRQAPPGAERRGVPRTLLRDLEGTMSWRAEGGLVNGPVTVSNISGGGAAILADRAPRVSEPIRLTLLNKPARVEPIEGHVIETRPDPSGKWVVHVRFVQWVPLGPLLEAHRERRMWERHPVREARALVTWLAGDAEMSIRGDLLNISGGGAAFLGDTLPPPDVPLWLQLEAAARQGDRIPPLEGRLLMSSFDPSGRKVAHLQFVDPCPPDFFNLAVGGPR